MAYAASWRDRSWRCRHGVRSTPTCDSLGFHEIGGRPSVDELTLLTALDGYRGLAHRTAMKETVVQRRAVEIRRCKQPETISLGSVVHPGGGATHRAWSLAPPHQVRKHANQRHSGRGEDSHCQ